MVEQLTLNQWVLGSSPRWCTNWPVGQVVKTPPSHGGISSSNLLRVTTKKLRSKRGFLFLSGHAIRPLTVSSCFPRRESCSSNLRMTASMQVTHEKLRNSGAFSFVYIKRSSHPPSHGVQLLSREGKLQFVSTTGHYEKAPQ